MNIAQISARALPFMGGTETHVDEVSARLAERGHQVTVLTTDPSNELPKNEVRRGFGVRRRRAWPRNRDWYFSPGIFFEIARGKFDVVHIQGVHTLVAPAAMLAAKFSRTPFVLTFHTGGHSDRSSKLRDMQWKLLAPLLRQASRLVAVCKFEKTLFANAVRVPEDTFVLARNGADMPQPSGVRPDLPPAAFPVISSVARLEHYKGHHRVINAMPEIIKRHPNAQLVIIGKGPYQGELANMVKRLGLEKRVMFRCFGPSERAQMADMVAASDVVTLLSEYEAHPIALTEALFLKRPVVVARTSGLTELADEGLVTGIELDASVKQIADAIDATIGTTPPPITIPTWEDCVDILEITYKDVVSGTNGETAEVDVRQSESARKA
jgi:glycosyltransferase involved in cell wall biosynthesis